jgi:hypothetical protein
VAYIAHVAKLLEQARSIPSPPEAEIQAACIGLANCPVDGYSPFTEDEVRVLASYREALGPRDLLGRIDHFWHAIVQNEWYAWIYAIHEIVEIHEFEQRHVNPFDMDEWKRYWNAPHLFALLAELAFIRQWAEQLGDNVTELALLREHPMRSQFTITHRQEIAAVQRHRRWPDPTPTELEAAQRFWNKRGKP